MTNFRTRNLFEDQIDELIAETAAKIDFPGIFSEKAKQASLLMSVNDIETMSRFFHESPPEPLVIHTGEFGGNRFFGVWMDACQDAIFEICYQLKEKSVPFLERVGFGVYDWTQYKALGILIRFARESVISDEIILKISSQLEDFRDITIDAIFSYMKDFPNPLSNEIVNNFVNIADEYGYSFQLAKIFRLSNPDIAQKYAEEELLFFKELKKGEVDSI